MTKGHCPQCAGHRNATVIAHHKNEWSDDEDFVWGEENHYILKCGGCDAIFHRKESVFSERTDNEGDPIVDTAYWPAPSKRSRPTWLNWEFGSIDHNLHSLTQDIYTALNADLRVMAAIGMRTAFDRAAEVLQIDPTKTFAQKLQGLFDIGKIGASERENLKVLTDAGSAAVHRGWRPSPEELDTLMTILEQFLYRTFVIDRQARHLKSGIPTKASSTQSRP